MHNQPAVLVLACGTVFHGISIGANGYGVGELVFNTSQLGYQEMLTDPSYAEQIITLTTAHVGNTGCNEYDFESSKIWAKGLVVRDSSIFASNYQKNQSLKDFLIKNHTVAIAGIDTRYLTQKLRDSGVVGACVSTDVDNIDKCLELAQNFDGLSGLDLAQNVSRQVTERWHEGLGVWAQHSKPLQFHVVVYDFGVKNAILRILHDLGCYLTIVPAKTPVEDVLQMSPEGVVLSNGPGDPSACDYAIAATKVLLEKNVPVFGICLGFQILALASGAKAIKMKFGHHGSNHPVIEVGGNKRVYITSQNHGFAIDENSLPKNVTISHRSLFDNSLQGIIYQDKPAFGFQGHPEASPGPHDIIGLFEKFVNLMMEYK